MLILILPPCKVYMNIVKTVTLIRDTYNGILFANYHKYLMHKDNKNSPKLEKYNLVMFMKDSNFY